MMLMDWLSKWFEVKEKMNPIVPKPPAPNITIGGPPSYEYRYLREKETSKYANMHAAGLGDGGEYTIERRLSESDEWEFVTKTYREDFVEDRIKHQIARDAENWKWENGPKEIYLGRRP